MRRSVLRAAVGLADVAERRIRAAGRVPPAHADVIAALLPAAAARARAVRECRRAARAYAAAVELAEVAGVAAQEAAAGLADAWVGANPGPRLAEFDPSQFRVQLVPHVHGQAVTEPAQEDLC